MGDRHLSRNLHNKLVVALDGYLLWIGFVTFVEKTGSGEEGGYEVHLSDASILGTYRDYDMVDKFATEIPPKKALKRTRVPNVFLPLAETLMECTTKVIETYQQASGR